MAEITQPNSVVQKYANDEEIIYRPNDVVCNELRDKSLLKDARMRGLQRLPSVLNSMGFSSLREGQSQAVMHLLGYEDTICILPTGTGKSAVYVVPTLCHDWRCLIFSPLVALMKDQLEGLWRLKLKAAQVSSAQTPNENSMALNAWSAGELQFLLVAPERLQSDLFWQAMHTKKPNLVTVDEAHAASDWGDSFRPYYTKIGYFLSQLKPDVALALTATATPNILRDIERIFGLANARKVIYCPRRSNLKLRSSTYRNNDQILQTINSIPGSTLVYCVTTARVEELYYDLKERIDGESAFYHGKLTPDARTTTQDLFMSGETRVMFSTNAFGMGVNKADIRGVIHRDVPNSVESVTQETGRAGRDGKDSVCHMFFSEDALSTNRFFVESKYPLRRIIESVYYLLNDAKDKENQVMMTGKMLAEKLRLNEKFVSSAIGLMRSFDVLDRAKSEKKIASVSVIRTPSDDHHRQFFDSVRTYGAQQPDGSFAVDVNFLWKQLGISSAKGNKLFSELEGLGSLVYRKPYRGSVTVVKGDLSKVDWTYIDQRRALGLQRVESVRDYVDCDDDKKHDFILEYFGLSEHGTIE